MSNDERLPRFIGQPVRVVTGADSAQPIAFHWQNRAHDVVEVLMQRSDWGFSAAARRRNWRSRRHRNVYRVRTRSGEIFELYLDRGTKPGHETWVLALKLPDTDAGPPTG